MTALASVSASSWIPEDDLLLKNAVEAGASLDALAKGAVQFSRRFTVQELKHRWHSLLYDPDISADAAAHMVQLEPSVSNFSFKSNRLGNFKENAEFLGKRKVESIRRQYNAMRKRIHSKPSNCDDANLLDRMHTGPSNSNDLNFLDAPNANGCACNGSSCEEHIALQNEPPVGSYSLGDQVLSHFGLKDNVPQDIPHIIEDNLVEFRHCSGFEDGEPRDGNLFNNNDFGRKPLPSLDSVNTNLGNIVSEFGEEQHYESPVSDDGPAHRQIGFPSPLPKVPLWKTIEDISAPVMPINVNQEDRIVSAEDTLALTAENGNKPFSSGYNVHSQPTLKDACIELNNPTATTDSEFADLPDSLLNFTEENELLFMEVDGKDTVDKSCTDNLGSVVFNSPNEAHVEGMANLSDTGTLISGTSVVIPGNTYLAESVVRADVLQFNHSNQEGVHSETAMPSSTSNPNPHPSEQQEGVMCCTLNTEDTEIPCNDDIFLPANFVSTTQPIFEEVCEPALSSDIQMDSEQAPSLMNKDKNAAPSLKASQIMGKVKMTEIVSAHQLIGYGIRSELSGNNCLAMVSRHGNRLPVVPSHHSSSQATPNSAIDGVREGMVLNVKSGEKEALGTCGEQLLLHSESGSAEMNFLEPVVNSLMSDQEGSGSDDDVPDFSDIEAMILEMDLCPEDQDSYIHRDVSRYQHEDARKVIMRLEQCAQSSMQRAITSQGALAIFYGHHLKQYIRKTEVILGRATNEIDVDIDLSKEGRANKISRRQAIIKMQGDGSFLLKNLGKNTIILNGLEVATGQVGSLSSSSLIEIREMRFVFEVNQKSVRQYLANVAKKGKGKSTNFEWSPNGVP